MQFFDIKTIQLLCIAGMSIGTAYNMFRCLKNQPNQQEIDSNNLFQMSKSRTQNMSAANKISQIVFTEQQTYNNVLVRQFMKLIKQMKPVDTILKPPQIPNNNQNQILQIGKKYSGLTNDSQQINIRESIVEVTKTKPANQQKMIPIWHKPIDQQINDVGSTTLIDHQLTFKKGKLLTNQIYLRGSGRTREIIDTHFQKLRKKQQKQRKQRLRRIANYRRKRIQQSRNINLKLKQKQEIVSSEKIDWSRQITKLNGKRKINRNKYPQRSHKSEFFDRTPKKHQTKKIKKKKKGMYL